MLTKTGILRIYFIRHGETQENREGIIQGQADTKLNEIGVKQANLVGEALKDVEFAFSFSSDLKRAVTVSFFEGLLSLHVHITYMGIDC